MVKTKNLSVRERAEIIGLPKIKKSNREIAKLLKISRRTVDYNVKKFLNTNEVTDKKKCGRPRKTTTFEDKLIVRLSSRKRRLTASEINIGLKNISVSTVKRRLREVGLNGRVAVKKPLLRKANVKKRLKWARKHKNWTVEDWKKVLWSDESKFEVFGSKRRIYVRRHVNEKYLPECIVPSVKHGGGSVMVWGCFGGTNVGDLIKIEGILNKEGYKKILQKNMVSSGTRLIGPGFVFQQDNDPKHSSKLCKNYLENLSKKKKLKVMEWPPQSPDLNPIELLWEELDRAVRKICPTSAFHLWTILQKEWSNITSSQLEKLILRMPRLCKAVIKSKGYHFDEKKV